MDTALTLKPPLSVSQAGTARADIIPVQPAVRTQLGPGRSVTPGANPGAVRNDMARPPDSHARDVVIDPQSREVLYRAIDVRARQAARQVPDQALRRSRVYARALAEEADAASSERQADREV